ncbi:MAG TPA: hypothetical protein VFS67_01175 [Polyangiaceae bacterium]|nr:hypothetical protein [Polyangiaceae bacterium]
MTRASYAPANDPEFVKQAVAQQVVENRAARVTGGPEHATPVLGKDAQTTQGLREHAAATTLQNAFRAWNIRRHRQQGLAAAAQLNAMPSSPQVEALKDTLRESLPVLGQGEVMRRERSHAAALVMPDPNTYGTRALR